MEAVKSKQVKSCFLIRGSMSEKNSYALISFLLFAGIAAWGCKASLDKSNHVNISTIELDGPLNKEIINEEKYFAEFEKFKKISEIRLFRNEKIITEVETQMDMKKNLLDTSMKTTAAQLKQKNKKLKQRLSEHQIASDKLEWDSLKIKFEKDMRALEAEVQILKTGKR